MTDDLRALDKDIPALLKMAAQGILAGHSPSASRECPALVVKCETLLLLISSLEAAERRAERLQIELGDAKERYQILAREAARVVDGACISESMQDLRDTLRALEGREEKS